MQKESNPGLILILNWKLLHERRVYVDFRRQKQERG